MAANLPAETLKQVLSHVKVEIIEARDLLASDINGFSDPYVTIAQTVGMGFGFEGSVLKTPIVKKNLNPVWNFSTDIYYGHLFTKLTFRVFDWDRFSRDDYLGTCSVKTSLFNNGVVDVWLPLSQKPVEKKPGEKGPYPTKGELHVRLTPIKTCLFCDPGNWFAVQSLVTSGTEAVPQMVPADRMNGTPDVPYGEINIGFGYNARRKHLDTISTSLFALDSAGNIVSYTNPKVDSCFDGAVRLYKGPVSKLSNGYSPSAKDDVFTLNLQKLSPEIVRLAFVSQMDHSFSLWLWSAAFCVFFGDTCLAAKKIKPKLLTSSVSFLCLFQRDSSGRWFLQTVLQPLPGKTIEEIKSGICSVQLTGVN